jgi:maltose O-acetyltransferase
LHPQVFTSSTKGLIGDRCSFFARYPNSKTTIGNRFFLFGSNEILNSGNLIIGKNFSMNHYSKIISFDSIRIGDNVTIASYVSILDHDHKYELTNGQLILEGYTTSPICIGNNVWIGDKCTILKGVSIGDNVVIGANSVVTKDIESNNVAVGIPAKVIKRLS